MPGVSSKTKVAVFRLPVEVYAVLERKVKGKRSRHDKVNQYLKARVIYDTMRRH